MPHHCPCIAQPYVQYGHGCVSCPHSVRISGDGLLIHTARVYGAYVIALNTDGLIIASFLRFILSDSVWDASNEEMASMLFFR